MQCPSYRLPAGTCGGFTANADNSVTAVTEPCVGKQSCEVWANNDVFGVRARGVKRLELRVLCKSGGLLMAEIAVYSWL